MKNNLISDIHPIENLNLLPKSLIASLAIQKQYLNLQARSETQSLYKLITHELKDNELPSIHPAHTETITLSGLYAYDKLMSFFVTQLDVLKKIKADALNVSAELFANFCDSISYNIYAEMKNIDEDTSETNAYDWLLSIKHKVNGFGEQITQLQEDAVVWGTEMTPGAKGFEQVLEWDFRKLPVNHIYDIGDLNISPWDIALSQKTIDSEIIGKIID